MGIRWRLMAEAGWNYADVWEAVAGRFPEATALRHGNREVSWRGFDERANGVAQTLLDHGLTHQAKVAQYLRNGPEYMESMFAVFKAGLVPVNSNYRYGDDELVYLWSNSDSAAVVFHAEFTDVCDRLRAKLPHVRCWLRVDAATSCPTWAAPYEQAATSNPDRVAGQRGRSGDDLYLLYTGGTTGMPKGVMWRQDDLYRMLESPRGPFAEGPADPMRWADRLVRPDPPVMPAPPLMHGTACWFVLPVLSRGGAVVTLTGASYDPVELLDTVVSAGVRRVCIVGDAFAKPLLRELDAAPARWDLSQLQLIFSSGAMLSRESKQRLLGYAPNAVVVDGLGSSESGSLASTVTSSGSAATTARFELSPNTRVVDLDGHDVVPGSGKPGRLAVGGYLPVGYYGDPEKTAATFVELDGRRYVIAGDWAEVDEHGEITLLGRGSSCINTAGEKVYPEEVEEVIKQADGVHDAAVVGVPDDRFGEAVVALVEPDRGRHVDEAAVIAHVKDRLAAYKAPKRVIVVDSLQRDANGKLDHLRLKAIASEAGGRPSTSREAARGDSRG
jgi:3-oxocholest-4-en-26-oate---CoA ligase